MAIRTWESNEYRPYWQRQDHAYLDRVERRLLPTFIASGDWFVDLGGGYGRLLEIYRNAYANVIISDYSMSMLEAADRHLIQHDIHNVHLVAADVHDLPFADSRFDGAMMVRVIHHIENPEPVIGEVHRILKPSASFLFEYQNKRNLNALLKARIGLMRRQELDSLEPRSAGRLYWEFHPRSIEQALAGRFALERVQGGGIFWHRRFLTSLVPNLEAIDAAFAPFLGKHHLTHQLFLKLHSMKREAGKRSALTGKVDSITEVLRCLRCQKSDLKRNGNRLKCGHCNHSYGIRGHIYDFRREES